MLQHRRQCYYSCWIYGYGKILNKRHEMYDESESYAQFKYIYILVWKAKICIYKGFETIIIIFFRKKFLFWNFHSQHRTILWKAHKGNNIISRD